MLARCVCPSLSCPFVPGSLLALPPSLLWYSLSDALCVMSYPACSVSIALLLCLPMSASLVQCISHSPASFSAYSYIFSHVALHHILLIQESEKKRTLCPPVPITKIQTKGLFILAYIATDWALFPL